MEIRPGEGGDDAKQLMHEMLKMYTNYAEKSHVALELIDLTKA
jgi:protein subunit release factor A